MKLYIPLGARPTSNDLQMRFPSGMAVSFAHLEHEKNVYDWQGAQVSFFGFDEITHFTEKQFFYLLSRLRSTSGVPGYVRATCNPDAESWVRKFIDWWIDSKTGLPIQERSGILRWFIRKDDKIEWGNSRETFPPDANPKSVTFIPSKLEDNKILMDIDPAYRSNLDALPRVERMQLRDGNWNVRPQAGMYFQRGWFKMADIAPVGGQTIRYWDRAATEKTDANNPDYTVGLKLRRGPDGRFYVIHIVRGQWSPGQVEEIICNTADQDGTSVIVGIEQDPGQAGVVEATQYVKMLAGHVVKLNPVRKDKETRALPVSAQVEAGNFTLIRGPWNEDFLSEIEGFPELKKKDQVDAMSGAFALLLGGVRGDFTKELAQNRIKSTHAGSLRGGPRW